MVVDSLHLLKTFATSSSVRLVEIGSEAVSEGGEANDARNACKPGWEVSQLSGIVAFNRSEAAGDRLVNLTFSWIDP